MIELPLFENRRPDDSTVNLSGGVEFTPPGAPAHHLDETIYLVVQARVSKVAHSTDKDGALSRVHTATVEDLAVLDAEAGASLLLDTRRHVLEAAGISELPMDGSSAEGTAGG